MRVRILSSMADGQGNSWSRGHEYDLDEAQAQSWVAAGVAEPVDEPAEPDKAVRQAPRSAVRRGGK